MDQIGIVLDEVSETVHDLHVPLRKFHFFDTFPSLLRRQIVALVFQDLAEGKRQARQRSILAYSFQEAEPVARHNYVPAEVNVSQVLGLLDILSDKFEGFWAVVHVNEGKRA